MNNAKLSEEQFEALAILIEAATRLAAARLEAERPDQAPGAPRGTWRESEAYDEAKCAAHLWLVGLPQ